MGRRGDLAARANDVDDHPRSAGRHLLKCGIYDVNVGEVFRIHRRAPGGRTEVFGRSAPGCARAVYQNVDRTQLLFDLLDGPGRRRRIYKVGRHADACCAQPNSGPFDVALVARDDRDPCAFALEQLGAGKPDSLAPATHQNDLAFER
jgi:hypothetical protein